SDAGLPRALRDPLAEAHRQGARRRRPLRARAAGGVSSVPEPAEGLYRQALAAADAHGRLPLPPLDEWDTFPFEGEIRVRPLEAPGEERPRQGEGGVDCGR